MHPKAGRAVAAHESPIALLMVIFLFAAEERFCLFVKGEYRVTWIIAHYHLGRETIGK